MLSILRDDFVVGWHNIKQEDYVGYSCGYGAGDTAVGTSNGAGGHNVQLFVIAPDGVVLHALPGFWHPEDLARELQFAKVVARLWADDNRTLAKKKWLFQRLHRRELQTTSAETFGRSGWQHFDVHEENRRLQKDPQRDTFVRDGLGDLVLSETGRPMLKPTIVLAHERMLEQPFVQYELFDVKRFTDYGRFHYDNNRGIDGKGRKFRGQEKLQRARARATQ